VNFNYVRRGQDVRYAIDDSKLRALGWVPTACFNEKLKEIVETANQSTFFK